MELYKKHRPKDLDEIIGQREAVKMIKKFLETDSLPHALMFSGPSGTGKTTVARILKDKLGCSDFDFFELNSADFRGIDTIREIRKVMNLNPMGGKVRMWLIDEAHRLTTDAQNAFLKLLEDTPPHVYFILATTEPHRLIRTIHTRCTEVRFSLLSTSELQELITKVLKKEGKELNEDLIDEIVQAAQGSARKALVILEQVLQAETEEEAMRVIHASSADADEALKLVRLLIHPGTGWKEVANLLTKIEDQDPETIRWMVLGYCRKILLKGGKLAERAYRIMLIFSEPFYNTKNAGLAMACWQVIKGAPWES